MIHPGFGRPQACRDTDHDELSLVLRRVFSGIHRLPRTVAMTPIPPSSANMDCTVGRAVSPRLSCRHFPKLTHRRSYPYSTEKNTRLEVQGPAYPREPRKIIENNLLVRRWIYGEIEIPPIVMTITKRGVFVPISRVSVINGL